MKRKAIALLLAMLLVGGMIAGCSKKECQTHTDENKDGKCDVCEAAVICATHTDGDGNLTCDVCGIAITPICELHTDGDKNLICDVCGATVTATCDPHKDANADRICDMCGGAIVVITEYIAPKEEVRVEQVVNPIPSGVALGEYLKNAPESFAATHGEKLEQYQPASRSGRYLSYTVTSEAGTMTTCVILDLATGEERMRLTKPTAEQMELNLYTDYYLIRTQNEEGNDVYSYYSYDGVLFSEQTVPSGGMPNGIHEDYLSIPGYLRLTVGDRYHVIDPTADRYLFSLDEKTFVNRPVFHRVSDAYGYVEMENTVYVYDLSQWLSCVVSYEIPSYYENARWFVLENGNVLLQAEVRQSDRAVSYDFLRTDGEITRKYDLVFVMIDPVAKEAKPVEFGYWIRSVVQPHGSGIFTAKALNHIWVSPIVNDRIDENAARELITDNDLTVLCDCGEILHAAGGTSGITVVGQNLYLLRLSHNNGTVRQVVNEQGRHVAYLPEAAVERWGYVEYNGSLYNYKMELILDLAAEGYTVAFNYAEYRILSKVSGGVTEYYFFNGGAPVKIDLTAASVTYADWLGFAVRGTVNGAEVFRFYNANGTHLLDLEAAGVSAQAVETDVNAYLLTDENGTQYLIR